MSYESPASPSFGLVLVRITAGAILAIAGWSKISEGVSPELVLGTRAAFETAPGFIRAWGEHVVLPNPALFANLIAWGELLGGLALFLGLLTRPVGLAVAVMMANFYLVGPEAARSLVLLLGIAGLGCSISRAGQSAGADVFLVERLPAWLTWTRAA
jgi:putative oxidoreductase